MKIPYVKMHGAGNEFIMLNGYEALPENLGQLSKILCHKKTGLGADQILIAYPSEKADFRMVIYNADGGEVEMCGNGIRCFLQYIRDLELTDKTSLSIETLGGLIVPNLITDHAFQDENTVWVKVDLGKAVLEGRDIPVDADGEIIALNKTFGEAEMAITCVSMGNPHCVIFVDDVEQYPVQTVGPIIEKDAFFPNRVNVEFVQVKDRQHLIQRTWERGAGETMACGTGAAAVCVAAVLNSLADREVKISLKGGDLELRWDEETGHVFKTGPATTVSKGVFDYDV